jgi:hypothetical protein
MFQSSLPVSKLLPWRISKGDSPHLVLDHHKTRREGKRRKSNGGEDNDKDQFFVGAEKCVKNPFCPLLCQQPTINLD